MSPNKIKNERVEIRAARIAAKTALIVAIIGLLGTLLAAFINNLDEGTSNGQISSRAGTTEEHNIAPAVEQSDMLEQSKKVTLTICNKISSMNSDRSADNSLLVTISNQSTSIEIRIPAGQCQQVELDDEFYSIAYEGQSVSIVHQFLLPQAIQNESCLVIRGSSSSTQADWLSAQQCQYLP